MKKQEDYIRLDYRTGALVRPSPSARVEGDPASLGVGLIMEVTASMSSGWEPSAK